MIELKLNWFTDDESAEEEAAEEETVIDVPDVPGIGGVLTVWKETLADESVVLRATYNEVADALSHGWVVAIFDGAGTCALVTEASESDGTYTVTDGTNSYTSEDPNAQMEAAEAVNPD